MIIYIALCFFMPFNTIDHRSFSLASRKLEG